MPDDTESTNFVSVKVPAFMETAVSGWFAICEAQFILRNINTSPTKFYHILSHLPPEVISKLSPTVIESKDYDILKTTITNSYEKTKPELFAKLMNETIVTGRPSMFLQEIMALANKVGVGEDLVRHRFIQALPSTIAPAVAAQSSVPLAQLGKLADELMPLAKQAVNQVSEESEVGVNAVGGNKIQTTLPQGLKPFTAGQRPLICRAHLYYASEATSCRPWCKWPNKNPALLRNQRSQNSVNPNIDSTQQGNA